MVTIRMTVDHPERLAGKLYRLPEPEGRALVESGAAAWEYVPEAERDALPAREAPVKSARKWREK